MTYEPKTYEELLMTLITKAFEAMTSNEASLFDGVIDSIEILLKVETPMYNDFMSSKIQLYEMAKNNLIETEKKLSSYNDELLKDFVKRKEEGEISWDFRKDVLETVLNVLSKYNKIAYTNQNFAVFNQPQSVQQFEPKQVQQPVQQPVQQQVQQPVQQQTIEQLYQQVGLNKQQEQLYQQAVLNKQSQEQNISEDELHQLLMNKQEKQPTSKFNRFGKNKT
jgi:hypothetical protein